MHWNAVTLLHIFGKVKALSLTLSTSPLYSVWRIFDACPLSSGGCTYRETVMIQQFFIVTFHHNSVISTRPDKFYTHFPKLSLKAHLMSPPGSPPAKPRKTRLATSEISKFKYKQEKTLPKKKKTKYPRSFEACFQVTAVCPMNTGLGAQ